MRGHVLVATPLAEEGRSLCATVSGWGHDVRCVSSVAELEASIHENLPAALVLTLDMPPDGALSFLQRERESFDLSNVAVVVLADSPSDPAAAKVLELGAVAVLERFAPEERLRAVLATVVRPAARL